MVLKLTSNFAVGVKEPKMNVVKNFKMYLE